jgi:hypothetical protein
MDQYCPTCGNAQRLPGQSAGSTALLSGHGAMAAAAIVVLVAIGFDQG